MHIKVEWICASVEQVESKCNDDSEWKRDTFPKKMMFYWKQKEQLVII